MRTAILAGGGLKTQFLIELAKKESSYVALIFFDMKGKNYSERKAVEYFSKHYKCELRIVKDANLCIPWDTFKLSFMIMKAAYIARHKLKCHLLYTGVCQEDHERIPEATPNTFYKLQSTISTFQPKYDDEGWELSGLEIEAPLILLNRTKIIMLGSKFETPWQLSISCERLNGQPHVHCGECYPCRSRHCSFLHLGIPDPSYYKGVSHGAFISCRSFNQHPGLGDL